MIKPPSMRANPAARRLDELFPVCHVEEKAWCFALRLSIAAPQKQSECSSGIGSEV
jgi:hypothetical protein